MKQISCTAFRQAKKHASNSNHNRFHMGAVIVKGGRILSAASNQINRGCAIIQNKRWDRTLHAEAHAIYKLLKKGRLSDLAGSTLYVTRVNKQGSVMLAKPCPFCQTLIAAVGIKETYYTTNTGDVLCV